MKYFEIGRIVNTQGIKGELRVIATTYDPHRFELLNEISVFRGDEVQEFTIERVWYHKKFVILKLHGIDDMNLAERFKKSIIKIKEDKVLSLEEDEYYIGDLYNMQVFSDSGDFLGVLEDIIETGANDVYCIKNEAGKKILIPAIKQCILKVDISERIMTVKLIKGLDWN